MYSRSTSNTRFLFLSALSNIILSNEKCDLRHESGLTNRGLLGGSHDRGDALEGLRQTWPRRGDEYVATCICGSTNPFRMFCGRNSREQFGASPFFFETYIATRLTKNSSHSRKYGVRGGPFYSDTKGRGGFAKTS